MERKWEWLMYKYLLIIFFRASLSIILVFFSFHSLIEKLAEQFACVILLNCLKLLCGKHVQYVQVHIVYNVLFNSVYTLIKVNKQSERGRGISLLTWNKEGSVSLLDILFVQITVSVLIRNSVFSVDCHDNEQ